ncbi:hypothetical protein PAXRUDRAFT_164415 [Paxillus rubicundulus Ve08.2h10]|uniref:Reverse transcriptase zinc-binding domain-containing protein n=1 Tax=Paxillus rubicundulus Ve08.2h10 TaxID=930991 RepID=A0A0D0DC80_9AGAM|nr:hypothetical protein PAXRUDRAFT_164415 [Paxillus rubicundulus Ve08.2h10]
MLTHRNASLVLWLRMKHITLNAHRHRMTRSITLDCPHCPGTKEDIVHFILACPQYVRECHILRRKLRRQALNLPYLLSNSKAVTSLIDYIHSMGRLKATFGEVPNPNLIP